MIKLDNRLCDNNLSSEELLKRIVISKTSYSDALQIVNILVKCFDLSSAYEALTQLLQSKAILDNSIKLIDKETNDIYGLLIFSDFPIHIGSPLINIDSKLASTLSKYKQLNGHSFIIDERLRGANLDKKMLQYNHSFIQTYDLIWCAVEKTLKSQNYWKRLGFMDEFETDEANFYIKYLNNNIIDDIYRNVNKTVSIDEDNNNQ